MKKLIFKYTCFVLIDLKCGHIAETNKLEIYWRVGENLTTQYIQSVPLHNCLLSEMTESVLLCKKEMNVGIIS